MNTVLQTKGLCKTYIVNKHQNNVLKNIDLMIREGEMVAVMGPSGSGKSTLAKAKEQSKQSAVAEGKKHRTHSKGKGDMAL